MAKINLNTYQDKYDTPVKEKMKSKKVKKMKSKD